MTLRLNLRNVVAGATCLAVSMMFLSCKGKNSNSGNAANDDSQAVVTEKMMSITTVQEYLTIYLKGSGEATVNWGDGTSDETFTLDEDGIKSEKYLAGAIERTVTIVGENITYLDCNGNQLASLNVSNNTALTYLDCGSNQLTGIDVSKNIALTDLICDHNQLTTLDVSNNTALTKLYCYDNQLTNVDVTNNTALTWLEFGKNQMTTLDVRKNKALTILGCSENQLTSLDVRNNTALTEFSCILNQLTSLDVSKNIALKYLECGGNQLTSLDLSKNTELYLLSCIANHLSESAVNFMLGTLHGNTIDGKVVRLFGNYGTEACDKNIAEKNGWTVDTEFNYY